MQKTKNKTEAASDSVDWISVIGRGLAYLCLREALKDNPKRLEGVLEKVDFLQGLGLTPAEAATIAGSTLNSVQVMRSRRKSTGGKKGG